MFILGAEMGLDWNEQKARQCQRNLRDLLANVQLIRLGVLHRNR